MTRRSLVRALGAVGTAHRRPARQQAVPAAARKDFSVVPVCGSVRPLADQRARRHLTA